MLKATHNFFYRGLIGVSAVIALVFLHLGVNEYLSIQFIAVGSLSLYVFSKTRFIRRQQVFTLMVLFCSFLIPLISNQSEAIEFLVAARFLLAILVLILAQNVFYRESIDQDFYLTCISYAAVLIFLVALAQFINITVYDSGALFLGSEFYGIDYGTTDLTVNTSTSRAKAFFSEPSTLAGWGLMVFAIGLHKNKFIFKALGLSSIILSSSVSGLVLGAVLLTINFLSKGVIKLRFWPIIQFMLFIMCLLVMGYFLEDRLVIILNSEDASSVIRILVPVKVIWMLISSGDFTGLARSDIVDLTGSFFGLDDVVNTFIFNLYIWYGIFGFVILGLVLSILPKHARLFFICLGMINGDVFYYDRVLWLIMFLVATSEVRSDSSNDKMRETEIAQK